MTPNLNQGLPTHCGHGVSYTERCVKCRIVWLEEVIRFAKRDIEKAEKELAILQKDA